MSTPSTRRFPGLKEVLRKGRTGVINVPSTTRKNRKRERTSSVPNDSLPPVYVSIYEGKGLLRGQIGVASIDPSTSEFHLFNFAVSEGFTSLKSLLLSLVPSDVIIFSLANQELRDAVVSVCQRADISTVKKTYYEDGKEVYDRLTDSEVKQNLNDKEPSLLAFAALVKFAEHQSSSIFAPSSCTINLSGSTTLITCPLCENDDNEKKPCKMGTIKQFQEHFFHYHWQVHGYACHLCGQMYSTAEQLMTQHVECDEFTRWKAAKEKEGQGKLPMLFCRMMLCCADCGWHTILSERDEKNEQTKMNYLSTFFAHHNNDGLLSMLVYFPGEPTMDVDSIKFGVHLTVGGDPTASCKRCHSHTFKDPSAANEHYMKHHSKHAVECGIDGCNARVMTQYLLEQHQFQHVHENSFFADFLSNSARIFPPPTNLSYAPRSGWKDRAKTEDFAFGGVIGVNKGRSREFNLVDSAEEDTRVAKARLIKKKDRVDKGFQNAIIPLESDMVREVRLKLEKYRDCEGISGILDDSAWLRDEDAVKFQDWMEYWESEEGKELGGPPKEKCYVDVSSSFVRIPSMEVELQLTDRDVLSGFLLNDNIFYCNKCDSIHKGKEAFDHLKKDGEEPSSCAEQATGEVVFNPNANDNMIQLHSSSTSTPSSSLACPYCPMKACSITGLRVHFMTDHDTYVRCKKIDGEVVGVTRINTIVRPTGAKKRRMRRSGEKMKGGEGRNEDGENEVALDGDIRVTRSAKRKTVDARAVKQTMGRIVTDIAKKEDRETRKKRREEAAKEDEPEPMLVEGNGDTDNDVVMMTEDEVGEAELPDVLSMEVENDERREEVDEEREMETEVPKQPVVRQFTPDGDDDLCVVGEVNPGFSAFQPTIANQREKKFGCPRCSERFMTKARLENHLETTHRQDAGGTTIAEVLGIPLAIRLFICKNCCLAFPTPEMKAAHARQHDDEAVDCETCSGYAYNKAVLDVHHKRVKAREVSYICGECLLSFEHETNLHEHSNVRHNVTLFYFCKRCEIGSTNGVDMYSHYVRERCSKGPVIKLSTNAVNCIGVIPANQLHFQPISLDIHRVVLEMHPKNYVDPSDCTHRSMIVATDRKISCREVLPRGYECRGMVNMATYIAEFEANTGRKYEEQATHVEYDEPLQGIRRQFHNMLIEQQKKVKELKDQQKKVRELAAFRMAPPANRYQMPGNAAGRVQQEGPSRSVATVSSGAPVRKPSSQLRAQADTVRPPLTLLTDQNVQQAGPSRDARLSMPNQTRNQNTMSFLGGTRMSLETAVMNRKNEGGGVMRGTPVSMQSRMGNQNGGGMMRGTPTLAQSLGYQSGGGGMMRGGTTLAAARANGEPQRMMNWARQRGYSVARDTNDHDGSPMFTAATADRRADEGRDTAIVGHPMASSNPSNGHQSIKAGADSSTSTAPSPSQNIPSTGL